MLVWVTSRSVVRTLSFVNSEDDSHQRRGCEGGGTSTLGIGWKRQATSTWKTWEGSSRVIETWIKKTVERSWAQLEGSLERSWARSKRTWKKGKRRATSNERERKGLKQDWEGKTKIGSVIAQRAIETNF